MLPGHDSTERPPAAGPSAASGAAVPAEVAPSGFRLAGMSRRDLGLIMALGMILVFAGSTEDAGSSWGALFMNAAFEVTPFMAGMAFVALQGAQTIGRFTGDFVVDRLGDRTTARLGALLAGAGKIGRDTSELQSRGHLVCRLLLEKKKKTRQIGART